MSLRSRERDLLEISLLFGFGLTSGIAGVIMIDQVPFIEFPYNLNTFFWSLVFILVALFPAAGFLCRGGSNSAFVVSVFLFVGGSAAAMSAPILGATGDVIYQDGMNIMLYFLVLIGTVPMIVYMNRSSVKRLLLGSILLSTILIYLFVAVYLVMAFNRAEDATMFVPLLGATGVAAGIVSVYWRELSDTVFRPWEE